MCPAKAICPAPYVPQRVLFYANPRKGPEPKKKGGQNKILRPDQHQAMIRYAVDQATNGGKGATKQMMYNWAMWLRVQEIRQSQLGGGFSYGSKIPPNYIRSRRNQLRATGLIYIRKRTS